MMVLKGLSKRLIVFLFIAVIAPLWASAAEPEPNKVADVNGTVITRQDLDSEFDSFRQRMMQQGQVLPEAELEGIRKQLLNQLIDRELLYQDSQKKGIKITDSVVDAELSKLKGRFPSEEAFKNAMAASNTTESELLARITEGLAIRELIDTYITPKVSVTEKEVKAFYDENASIFQQPEQVKASHILIKVEADADDAQKSKARKQIEDIQKEVAAGADFGQVAKEKSQGPSSANNGDLGFFGRGQMVKPFETAAFELEVGQVSPIVETQFGYHLIKVTDKKPAAAVPLNEVEEKISEYLKQNKLKEEVDAYLKPLRDSAKIEKFI